MKLTACLTNSAHGEPSPGPPEGRGRPPDPRENPHLSEVYDRRGPKTAVCSWRHRVSRYQSNLFYEHHQVRKT